MGWKSKFQNVASSLKGKQSPEQTQLKKEMQEQRAKGFRDASLKRSYNEGVKKGQGGGGVLGTLGGLNSSINNVERAFGFDKQFGGGGSGFDLGFGGMGEPAPKRTPQRITRVTRSGTVIITEPIERRPKKKVQNEGVHNFFDDIPNFLEE